MNKEIIDAFDNILLKIKSAHNLEIEALQDYNNLKLIMLNEQPDKESIDSQTSNVVDTAIPDCKPQENNKIIFCKDCHKRIKDYNYSHLGNNLYLCDDCYKLRILKGTT